MPCPYQRSLGIGGTVKHWYVTGPRVLECVDEPMPVPGDGEVLVRVAYTALSPGSNVHVYRTGTYRHEFSPGRTDVVYMGSGTIDAVGPGVDEGLVGAPVAFNGGGHQPFAAMPADKVKRVPDGLSLRDASLSYLSAWSVSVLHLGEYVAAESVVVIGLGLVGASAALVADCMGGRVLGIDTAPERLAFAKGLGIGRVAHPDDAEVIQDFLGPAGPDLIIETSGAWPGFRQAITLARDYSRIAVMGIYRQPPPADLALQMFGEAFDFPSKFHYQRLRIIGCGYDPETLAEPMPRSATRSRNFAYTLEQAARDRLPLGKLVTDVVPAGDIEAILERFASGDRSMVGVVFDWSTVQ